MLREKSTEIIPKELILPVYSPITGQYHMSDQIAHEEKKATCVVQIGNSDNKLTQCQWAAFAFAMQQVVNRHVNVIHFCGGSAWFDAWQNACVVGEINETRIKDLKLDLSELCSTYSQDSIALTIGPTEFVTGSCPNQVVLRS